MYTAVGLNLFGAKTVEDWRIEHLYDYSQNLSKEELYH